MKTRAVFFSVIFLVLAITSAPAQVNRLGRFSLAISPMHLFVGSVKLEAEVRTGKFRNSFSIAPQYYFSNLTDPNYPLLGSFKYNFQGYGLEVQHKLFLNKVIDSDDQYDWRLYLSYGVGYYAFQNIYTKDVWYPYENDGLNYFAYGPKENSDIINRWKFSILTGVQKRTRRFLFEAFSGFSYQSSIIDAEYNESVDYENGFWKYGYTGYLPRFGIKIGVFL